jgi:hypothetical protein
MGTLGPKSLSVALGLCAVACANSPAPPPIAIQASQPEARSAPEQPVVSSQRSTCATSGDAEPIALPARSETSAENLRAWVFALAGPELRGREAGTHDSKRAARSIADYFQAIGASPPDASGYCRAFAGEGYRDQNVIAHLAPSVPDCGWIVLGAHYDALGVDKSGNVRPGADDDATGIAVMLEVARLVVTGKRRPRPGLVLAAFGAEEKGLVGSQAYVSSPTVPLNRVALMVNVDMAGRKPGGKYPSIGWEPFGPNRRSTAALVRSAAMRVQVGAIPMRLGDRGDSASFAPHVPTLFFSTAVHPDYHEPTDTPERVDYGQVDRALRLVLELVERVECVRPSPAP